MSAKTSATTIRRRMRVGNRACKTLAALLWPAALAVWILHNTGVLRDETTTALLFCWFIAAAAYGVPAAGLRILGPYLTARVCTITAAVLAGAAAIITFECATGMVHLAPPSLYASLILPMTIGMRAYNTGEYLARRDDAYRKGVRDGRALEAHASEENDATDFNAMPTDELRCLARRLRQAVHVAEMVLEGRVEQESGEEHVAAPLHVVRTDERRTS